MNYKIDEKIIHDDKAMWDMALSFKIHYDLIKEQVEKAKTEKCIYYEGNLIMHYDDNFKKIVSEYENGLELMNKVIALSLKQYDRLREYIEVEGD